MPVVGGAPGVEAVSRAWLLLLLVGCTRASVPARPSVLWFGGDVHVGTAGVFALDELRLDGPLVVNLEGPLSPAPRPSTSTALFNSPETVAALRRAHVVAAGVDNNHALDDGAEGLERTRARLTEAGIAPLGAATVEGVRLLQVDLSNGLPAELEARLRAERPDVLLLHVLAPPLYFPEPELRTAAELAWRLGVPAVLAHGNHSIGPVERRGAQIVAWGLGNLVFDCDCTSEDEGLLVRLELDAHRLVRASVVPVRAGLHGDRARSSPDVRELEAIGSSPLTRKGELADF